MESLFLQKIQEKVAAWRAAEYKGVYDETRTILRYIKGVHFLNAPQVRAFETYIYLKEIKRNKHTRAIFRSAFTNELEFLRALGTSDSEALELAYDPQKDEK